MIYIYLFFIVLMFIFAFVSVSCYIETVLTKIYENNFQIIDNYHDINFLCFVFFGGLFLIIFIKLYYKVIKQNNNE